MANLKRSLSLTECVFFGVGSILGAGIYTLIGKVAGLSGNLIWISFLIASIAAICTAFSYAELSAAFPKAGGEFVYAKKAFGKKIGVLLGLLISFNGIVGGATVSIGFAGYLKEIAGVNILIGSLAIITFIFFVNVSGIRESSIMNMIFTILEAVGLLLVIATALPSIGEINYTESPSGGINDIFAASALAFFAYMGFEDIVKLAEETKRPEKNIPRALFISCLIVIFIYSLIAICAVSVVPYQELEKSESPLADVIGKNIGNSGILIISFIALFATSNTVLSNMLGSSRILFHMSKETKSLKLFSFISPNRRTPVYSLILIFFITCCFALIGKIEVIARITTISVFITFIIVNLSVIFLRFREITISRPYRIPLNIRNIPIISVFGILITFVLLGYNIFSLLR
jgi:basic amino acid/polyamine antiporter, APA family